MQAEYAYPFIYSNLKLTGYIKAFAGKKKAKNFIKAKYILWYSLELEDSIFYLCKANKREDIQKFNLSWPLQMYRKIEGVTSEK